MFAYGYDTTRRMQVARLWLPNSAYIANTYDSVARLTGILRCKQSSAHIGVHKETEHWVDWWANFRSAGWYSETPD